MEAVVILLAGIGAIFVGFLVVGALGKTGRVLRAAHQFQAASIEAVEAIRALPADELRQIRAIAAWERARAFVHSLSPDDQLAVVRVLRGRGFPISEVGEAIAVFIEAKEREGSPELDAELAQIVSGRA